MQHEQIKQHVRAFVERSIRSAKVSDDQDIFASGFVTSLFAMQLVMFVEREFALSVRDEDLVLDNFRSVEAITRLVERVGKG